LANGAQIWQMAHKIQLVNEDCLIFGEIEWHIFSQKMCACIFSLGAQSLVKSIRGVQKDGVVTI